MILLIGPVMVGIMDLKLSASCFNLCSNSSIVVENIGLNIPLIKTKLS